MTLPRIDRLDPPVEQPIPQRGITVEKLAEGELSAAIEAELPTAGSLAEHDLTAHLQTYAFRQLAALSIEIGAGKAAIDATVYAHGPTYWTLLASQTYYAKITGVGAVLVSTAAFVSGQIPLYIITTDASSITSVQDMRALFARGGGGSGGGAGTLQEAYDGPGGTGSGRIIDANNGEVLIRNLEADAEPNLRLQRAPGDMNTLPSFKADALAETNPRFSLYGNRMQGRFDGSAGGASGADWWIGHYASGIIGFHDNGTTGTALELRTVNEPSTPAGNFSRLYSIIVGSSTFHFLKDSNARNFGPIGTKEVSTIFGRGAAGGYATPLNAWNDAGSFWGTLAPATSWTATGATSVANNTAIGRGRYSQFQAAAGVGNDCGIESPAVFWANAESSFLFRVEIDAVGTTSSRLFVGLAAQTLATMVSGDNPGTNHVGIQLPTGRANANWWFVERGTGSQSPADSGQSAGANQAYYIRLVWATSNAVTYLLDQNGTVLAQHTVNAVNKPGGTTLLSAIAGAENQSAGTALNFRVYLISHHNRAT